MVVRPPRCAMYCNSMFSLQHLARTTIIHSDRATRALLSNVIVVIFVAASASAQAPKPSSQVAVHSRSTQVPVLTQAWSDTASSTRPTRKSTVHFIGHFAGYSAAKQAANTIAAEVRTANEGEAKTAATSTVRRFGTAGSSAVTFDGPAETDTQEIPPDPVIAAGPNYLVVAVNTLLAIYDKTGVQQGGFQDLTGFFSGFGISGDLTDPRV